MPEIRIKACNPRRGGQLGHNRIALMGLVREVVFAPCSGRAKILMPFWPPFKFPTCCASLCGGGAFHGFYDNFAKTWHKEGEACLVVGEPSFQR